MAGLKALSTAPRFAALASLLITVAGFVIIVAGLARLQKTTNGLPALDGDTLTQYSTTVTSSLIQPYPNDAHFQYSWIWFIIFGNLFCVILAAAVLAVPAFHVGRGAALTFLAIITTLTIMVVNNLVFWYRNRSNAILQNFKVRDIQVTLAGALIVTLGQCLTILLLGFWEPWRVGGGPTGNYYGTNKAPVSTATTTTGQPHTHTAV